MDEVRYQIFVSSTFVDLKDEREKVLQAILEQRSFPAGMELFPSADEEQFDFIKREIDSSDYYILIIAGRYGSVASDGISFTEKEYDYAISRRKPVLAFLHHDIQQIVGGKLETTDAAQAKLRLFRDKASKGRLISFYKNPDDLKAKVLSSLVSQFNIKPMRGWVRAGQTPREVLENVTHLQQKVIDLEAENARLRALQVDNKGQLASGKEPISWTLDLNGFSFDNKFPKNRTLLLESTWDEMLLVVFPGGTSTVLAIEVEKCIARYILSRMPVDPQDSAFREASVSYLQPNTFYFTVSPTTQKVLTVVHRQFAGLGFLQEGMETVYVLQQYGAQPTPKTMSVWRLTPKGERHIALIGGYLAAASNLQADGTASAEAE